MSGFESKSTWAVGLIGRAGRAFLLTNSAAILLGQYLAQVVQATGALPQQEGGV